MISTHTREKIIVSTPLLKIGLALSREKRVERALTTLILPGKLRRACTTRK